ncbi:ATP-NAD kinase family protein [Halopseudomonas pelagia]|uniref:ATP-NAD kinase family protein n=1 Tax=Halopseudomonas pelagia TaxID=553151 RepID=UPI0030D9E3A4|tara:strand:+ start:203 stop:1432 length:1230 start_codon:yes stop_codon:yes gene_type:complete
MLDQRKLEGSANRRDVFNLNAQLVEPLSISGRQTVGKIKKIGLIVNPIAGMGGRVGLKGTDGMAVLEEARRRGARPLSSGRALQALKRLAASNTPFTLVTGAGELGEDVSRAAGLEPVVVYRSLTESSGPDNTRNLAIAMVEASVDLVLFAGGDGTARDVLSALNDQVPLLGIPTGVKMYSAVFGTNPENAGDLVARFIAGEPSVRFREAEIMDIDEAAMRNDQVSAQLYGYASSPYERHLVQNAKSGSGPSENIALDALCRQVVREMQPDCLYIIGPGTTTRRVMAALGLPATLLGVDVVRNGALIGSDLNEQALLQLVEGREARIIVSILGGHGSLFGRGNQQISSEVIRRVGHQHIDVITSMDKLISLETGGLRVDTGDAEVDAMLTGYMRVRTGSDRAVYVRVRS